MLTSCRVVRFNDNVARRFSLIWHCFCRKYTYIWCRAVAAIVVENGRFDQTDAFYGNAAAFTAFLCAAKIWTMLYCQFGIHAVNRKLVVCESCVHSFSKTVNLISLCVWRINHPSRPSCALLANMNQNWDLLGLPPSYLR